MDPGKSPQPLQLHRPGAKPVHAPILLPQLLRDRVARLTAYLIVGENGVEFSDPGDSGKLILLADGSRFPVALLWGGDWGRKRHGADLENWTYATDIGATLNWLEVDLVRSMVTP